MYEPWRPRMCPLHWNVVPFDAANALGMLADCPACFVVNIIDMPAPMMYWQAKALAHVATGNRRSKASEAPNGR